MTRRILLTALLLGSLAGATLLGQSNEPSLADAARQKSAAKAKRVVTNDQIPPSPDANKPVTPAATKTDEKGPAPDAATPGSKLDPQARLQQLTKENDELKNVMALLQSKIEASDDKTLIQTLGESVQHAKERIAKNDGEIAALKAGGASAEPGTKSQAPPLSSPSPQAPSK